jgi:hypothetical protein
VRLYNSLEERGHKGKSKEGKTHVGLPRGYGQVVPRTGGRCWSTVQKKCWQGGPEEALKQQPCF